MRIDSYRPSAVAEAIHEVFGPEVSVVLPVHDEEASLPGLMDEIASALANCRYEVVAVDDGSDDGSAACLQRLSRTRPWLRVHLHGRNRGQTAALATGISLARGGVVVLLDSDGQNDPADIPRLLAELRPGVDVVAGRRRGRHESAGRRLASSAANWLLRRASGLPIHDTGCTLKAFRATTLEDLRLLRGDHRFLPALARTSPERVRELWVADRPRTAGRSHYGFGRIPIVAADLLGLALRRAAAGRPLHTAAAFAVVMLAAWSALALATGLAGHLGGALVAAAAGLSFALLSVVLGTAMEGALRG